MTGALDGRVAVVTGGASAIGRKIALDFAAEGAKIAVGDLRRSPLGDETVPTVELIRDAGGEAIYEKTDVADEEAVESLIEATVDAFGGIDVLVNNAGYFPRHISPKTIEEITEEVWDRVIDVNVGGVYRCTRFAHPHLVESDHGRIINISSKSGLYGRPGASAYVASKGGVESLTKQMAYDYAPDEITVNTIAPASIITGTKLYRFEEKGDKMREQTLVNRLGEPRDVSRAAIYLSSDAGRFITGHTLVLDGGWTAW